MPILTMRKLFVLGVFCALSASAQSISIGLLGGAPFTDVVNSVNQNNIAFLPKSANFIVGPAFQVNLPLGLRVEVDALYRPYSFSAASTTATVTPAGSSTVNYSVSGSQWTFPFLLQYRFNTPILKPFIEAGASFDHLANISAAAKNIASGPGALIHQSNVGIVLGGGVDWKIPFVRISGELRYTHQGSADFQGLSNLNQAEVLVGVHF